VPVNGGNLGLRELLLLFLELSLLNNGVIFASVIIVIIIIIISVRPTD
jgi:hypothetical protein